MMPGETEGAQMPDISFGAAALAGILSFLSPCILPMLPFYLSYLAGISITELRDTRMIAPRVRQRMLATSLAFAFGVTTIFMLLGMGATALGRLFADWQQPLSWVAAGILSLFGLHLIGLIRVPILDRQLRSDGPIRPAGLGSAYAMGLAFGFGWTPCIGPALAAILLVASGADDPLRGAALLLVYGLSMTLPFVLAALFTQPFLGWANRHRRALSHIQKATGLMLIGFAALIASGSMNRIAGWMLQSFDWSATLI